MNTKRARGDVARLRVSPILEKIARWNFKNLLPLPFHSSKNREGIGHEGGEKERKMDESLRELIDDQW